jgi:hypothetical protein
MSGMDWGMTKEELEEKERTKKNVERLGYMAYNEKWKYNTIDKLEQNLQELERICDQLRNHIRARQAYFSDWPKNI